jgi:hypothetical protein
MTQQIIPLAVPRGLAVLDARMPALFTPDARAGERFFEFFTANIRNKNTRRALLQGRLPLRRMVRGQGTA